jgi:cobalamin biosynthetic protein CobC
LSECSGVGSLRPEQGVAHGGHLAEARLLFPGAPEPFLDLSTGINPFPYALPPLEPQSFTRLPEPDALAALERIAATAYGVADPGMVVAAPGTQILIDLLPRLWPLPRSVAVLGPTYAEHARAWARIGCPVEHVTCFAALVRDDRRWNRGRLESREKTAADVAVVCNPNNPDGRRIAPAQLLALANQFAACGGLLLVDEAFVDLEGDDLSLASALPHPALILLRSFGKTYGLAGVRLGFALTAPERAATIRAALGPWAVSGPAIAIGCQALADPAWRAQAACRLADAARMLDAELVRAGLRVIGGTRLFRLAETNDAVSIFARLGRAGILVRRFSEHPNWLRFGQPADPSAWQRLRAALSS